MKKIFLMIVPVIICGVVLTSCAKVNELEATKGLYAIGVKVENVPEDIPTYTMNNLVFTDDDIVSYRVSTEQIVFKANKVDEIISCINHYTKLQFFIDGKPVFTPPIATMYLGGPYCGSPLPWTSLNDLGLIVLYNDICFLTEGYMYLDDRYSDDEKESMLKQQEETANKRKAEMDVFIAYLSKIGKIIK